MKIKRLIGTGIIILAGLLGTLGSTVTAFAYSGEDNSEESVWVFDPSDESEAEGKEDNQSTSDDLIKIDAPEDTDTSEDYDGTGILTPEGNLTLVDDIDEEQSDDLQYMTVTTRNGDYFYIIVDRSGSQQNVYFLNAVDAADILSIMSDEEQEQYADMLDTSEEEETSIIVEDTTEEAETTVTSKENGTNSGLMTLIVFVLIGGVIAGGYYFVKIKPGRSQPNVDEDMEFYDDEEYESEEFDEQYAEEGDDIDEEI